MDGLLACLCVCWCLSGSRAVVEGAGGLAGGAGGLAGGAGRLAGGAGGVAVPVGWTAGAEAVASSEQEKTHRAFTHDGSSPKKRCV